MKNNAKILSLIVPSYNMERYLSRCLDSLITDDEDLIRALDVIVVNDGSKDMTSKIAHGYADKYPETFRVIDKENGNYGSCINVGLKVAIGKYVRPLDADDYVVKAHIHSIIQTMDTADADVFITDFTEVSDTQETLKERAFSLLPANELFEINDALCHYNLPMHALTYRTSFLRSIGYHQTEGIYYSDQEWDFFPFKAAKTLFYLPQRFYQYVIGRAGQTVDPQVLQKHMDSNTTVLLNNLRCMKAVEKNTVRYNYMFHFMQILSLYIYHTVLMAEPYSLENDKLLREADSQLKILSPELYDYLDRDVISFNMHLIRKWRNGKKVNLKLLRRIIPLYNLYLRIKHRLLFTKNIKANC
ncbi:MAG: glycosyltransferase [Bacteroidaceae bacterium]|nr:glycosyltransferase [Bacteroidaceae bacterium]